MKKSLLIISILVISASCSKESPYMTPKAIATVDRICGEYRFTSIELTDGTIDLDGDGTSSRDLMSEMEKTGWLGSSSPFSKLTSIVHPKTEKGRMEQILLYFPVGACEGVPSTPQTVSMDVLQFFYDVDDEGVITAPAGEFNYGGKYYEYSSIRNIRFSVLDNWDLEVCGTIRMYDRTLADHVYRTVLATYHCVSTKEKPKK